MANRKGYFPDKVVSNYVHEKLHFEKKRRQEKMQGKEFVGNKRYSNLKKRKIDALNRIFKSMANLTFYFECIAQDDELNKIFEDDTLDLLGLRDETSKERYEYIFSRLIRSILIGAKKSRLTIEDILPVKKRGKKPQEEGTYDFRLILTDLLQQLLNQKLKRTSQDLFGEEPRVIENVLDDFERARGWTIMLRNMTDREKLMEEPYRIFDFNTAEILYGSKRRTNPGT